MEIEIEVIEVYCTRNPMNEIRPDARPKASTLP